MKDKKSVVILLAEDDEDDYILTQKAFKEARLNNRLIRVKDGVELMEYLKHQGNFTNPESSPRPYLILLDLNMPRKDGREALKEIKSDPNFKMIPVVVLTTSRADEDVVKSYDLGVNSFVTKPIKMEDFVQVIKKLTEYWFELVQLPSLGKEVGSG